jgi:transcriptional regulator with XRE-family HTH domain
MPEIGSRVRERRRALRLSQENLASQAGLTWSAIQRLEAGQVKDPHYSTLSAIAGVLGTTVAELVGEESAVPLAEAPPETGFVITTEMLEEIEQSWNLPPGEGSLLLAYLLQTGMISGRVLQEARRELATIGGKA